jgi:hypothetical protein
MLSSGPKKNKMAKGSAREIYEKRLKSASPQVQIFHKYFMQLCRNSKRKHLGLSYDPNLISSWQLHRIVEKETMELPEYRKLKQIKEALKKSLRELR